MCAAYDVGGAVVVVSLLCLTWWAWPAPEDWL
jgi:hypothetical protein